MFIWNKKHYSAKQDVENTTVDELIKESTPINIPAKERLMKSPSNSYSSSYGTSIDTLHTSLIDDYHQTFIRFLCKDTQTDIYQCEECKDKNNKMIDIIGQMDQYVKIIEEIKNKLEENRKDFSKERDEYMQKILDLQIINENMKYDDEHIKSVNKKLYEDIEIMKKKNEDIEIENENLREENRNVKFEMDKIREENRNVKFEMDKIRDKLERITYKKDSYEEVKKKAILSDGGMDSQDLFTNRSDILGYIDEISHLKKINNELTNKLKKLNIQDECDFNRAIRSRFPVRFHAVHTDSYYLN